MPTLVHPVQKNSLRRLAGALLASTRTSLAKRKILAGGSSAETEPIRRTEWAVSVDDPTAFYGRCFRYFHQRLDPALKAHREYFDQHGRGFGEDAFHVMWQAIFNELRPQNFLEIGVFRGQTLSLISLLAQRSNTPCEVFGISPFNGGGDSACDYPIDLDYMADVNRNFERFGLNKPHLQQAYSTDPSARDLIASREWDLIYIDGNHDYPVVRADWELCAQHVRVGGVIVLDDAGSRTAYRPPIFATGGFPDVSRLVEEIDQTRFPLVLQVGHNLAFERVATFAAE